MAEVSDILDGMVSLLEGSTGVSPRTITAGRFKHRKIIDERVLTLAASRRPRPFVLEVSSISTSPNSPANVSGTYVYGAHTVVLAVFYSTTPQDMYALDKEMQDDEEHIRQCLEWPRNHALTTGWVGLAVEAVSYEFIGPSEPPDIKALVFNLRIDHRENVG